MEAAQLEKLGLTPAEAVCYLSLLQMGQTTTGPLAKRTHLHKPTVYAALDSLIEKGLATHVVRNNVRHFQAAPPGRLLDYADAREAEARQAKKELAESMKELENLSAPAAGRSARIFEGWDGMKTAFEDLFASMKRGDVLLVYGVGRLGRDERFLRLMSKFDREQARKGVEMKMIVDERLKSTMGRAYEKNPHAALRYLSAAYSTPAAFNVYKDKVLITVWTGVPTGILLQGAEIAESFRSHFWILWDLTGEEK